MQSDSGRPIVNTRGKSASRALESAFRILTRRDHTRRELAVKLRQRGFRRGDIDHALSRCGELGYLDDARTALAMAGHLAGRGYGSLRIRHTLGKKGVDEASIEKALAACGDEDAQVHCARRALAKKRPRLLREADPWKRRQMAYRFLSGRGFPTDVIRRAAGDICGENDRRR
jgi:regulatory protein